MTARPTRTLILLAVVLVALNMRGAITGVPPLLAQITADLRISRSTAGLLTSLPVLLFALAAPLSARLGRRMGAGHAVLLGLSLLAVGTLGRVLGGAPLLFLGTAVIGVGVTIGNILVPVVIKRDFGTHASRVTGYYVATMAIGATFASGLAVPLADWLGWRGALASWAVILPLAGIGWWLHVTRHERSPRPARDVRPPVRPPAPPTPVETHSDSWAWRVPIAWALALAMGTQSALFYAMTTWLPTILVDRAGLSPALAGTALSIYQILAIPTALTVAAMCRLRRTQGWIGVLSALGWTAFVLGLIFAPDLWPMWAVLGGLVQGGGFTYALTLIVLRGADEHAVRALGAMGQLVGYLVGAAGPFVAGWLAQTTGTWNWAAAFLVSLAAVMAVSSLIAGRNETVHAPAR